MYQPSIPLYIHEHEIIVRAEGGYGGYLPVQEYADEYQLRRSRIGSVTLHKTLDKPGIRWGFLYQSPIGFSGTLYIRGKRPCLVDWSKHFFEDYLDPGLLVLPKGTAYFEVFAALDDAAADQFAARYPHQEGVSQVEKRDKLIKSSFKVVVHAGQKHRVKVLLILYQPKHYNKTPGFWKLEMRTLGDSRGIKRFKRDDRRFSPFELSWVFSRQIEQLIGGIPVQPKPAKWIGNHVNMMHKPLTSLEREVLRLVDRGVGTELWPSQLLFAFIGTSPASIKRSLTRARRSLIDEGLIEVRGAIFP